jgi:recombination directionality factor gp3-like protein
MIHGLSERRRMNRLGKIRLGVWIERGPQSHPQAKDHFVCPEAVLAVLKTDKPRELDILFPSDDPEVLFPQSLKAYKGAKGKGVLWCGGDGQLARRRGEDGQLHERACPCELLEGPKPQCKAVATLSFMLPAVPGIGVWQIVTSSRRSIVSLNSDFELFRGLFGGLRGIPFTLKLVDEPFERWDDVAKKMRPDIAHVLKLDTRHTLQEIVEWRKALGKPVEMLVLPEATDEDEAEDGNGHGADWDISYAYVQAAKLGVDTGIYTSYLTGVYRGPDEMGTKEIGEQRTLIEEALADPTKKDLWVRAVREVAGKVRAR